MCGGKAVMADTTLHRHGRQPHRRPRGTPMQAGTSDPWWQVDLGYGYTVERVEVLPDAQYQDRLNEFSVAVDGVACAEDRRLSPRVAVEDRRLHPLVNPVTTAWGPNGWQRVRCGGTGRVLKISLKGDNRALRLCGVKVFVRPITPAARLWRQDFQDKDFADGKIVPLMEATAWHTWPGDIAFADAGFVQSLEFALLGTTSLKQVTRADGQGRMAYTDLNFDMIDSNWCVTTLFSHAPPSSPKRPLPPCSLILCSSSVAYPMPRVLIQ